VPLSRPSEEHKKYGIPLNNSDSSGEGSFNEIGRQHDGLDTSLLCTFEMH
jgi:signal transduction histidine kinase